MKNKKKSTASLSWKKVAGAKNIKFIERPEKRVNIVKLQQRKNLPIKILYLVRKKLIIIKVRAYYVKAGKNIYGSYSNAKSIKITK